MQRFVRWCVGAAVVLAILGLSGWLVGGPLLGGLVLLMAGLVALVAEEERQFELREAALGSRDLVPPPIADPPAPVEAPTAEPSADDASEDASPRADHSGVVTVFRLPATAPAEQVCVVGDFNDWSHTADPMVLEGAVWVAHLVLQPGRAYRFRYLLDGERWENDWSADAYVPNEFGGDDSVVDLSGWPAALVGATRGLHED